MKPVKQEKPYLTQEEMKQQWRSAIDPVVRERLQGEADEPLLSRVSCSSNNSHGEDYVSWGLCPQYCQTRWPT